MTAKLAALDPRNLEIVDDSARHAGHAGAKSGGHYQLTLVSPAFAGLSLVARHRLVYQTLGDMMDGKIHALSITALAPGDR
ncbi:MAG TPA: BolA family protein [Thiobacillaceae bacterium]|nr:BolA family protein [Thiobacillaceae bacterium]HNA81163.1 BolA family protein [Thiobacillaceae bacterium]HNF88948.1 BolA family protein [Thiobacillaceae bacterium]HNI08579.1 BolA family protein [Thiobacillaceae bacterium]